MHAASPGLLVRQQFSIEISISGFASMLQLCMPAFMCSCDVQGITGKLRNREYAGALDTLLSADGPGPERVILVVDHIELLAKHADGKKVSSICEPPSAAE